ncbi:site-specific integrase [Thermopolyspora sp. NPDC052614]|uniref:site-specific integrase n=1 Tax=Thermopolyspora sp. NPDC052614 TaxID=3155682 RepID=UPI00342429CF
MTRGLRRGELWGLEWVNIELDVKAETGWVAVREEEHEVGRDAAERASVKSEAGWRTVPLDRSNVLLLELWRRRQGAERERAGDAWTESGRVFTAEDGGPIRIDFIGDHFDVLVKRYGLPPVRFHDLRHCAATYLLAGGADLKMVAETLGHSQYSFTADTYANVLPDLAVTAAEAAVAVIPRRRSTGA